MALFFGESRIDSNMNGHIIIMMTYCLGPACSVGYLVAVMFFVHCSKLPCCSRVPSRFYVGCLRLLGCMVIFVTLFLLLSDP